MGNGWIRRCRWCYEVCRIRYPDEGYDVRRNVGFLFAGFAMANICQNIPEFGATLLLCAFVGLAIALYDYQINTKIKASAGSNVGGVSDGI